MNQKNLWTLTKIALGFAILYLLSKKIGINRITQSIGSMQNPILHISIAFLLLLGVYILGALCLYILLIPIKRVKLIQLFKYSSISWASGFIIPTADIFSLSYLLKKEGIRLGPSLAINFLDKVITAIVLSALSILAFIKFMSPKQAITLTLTITSLAILVIAAMSPAIKGAVIKFILRGHSENFAGFSRLIKFYLAKKKMLLTINAVLTIVKFMFTAGIAYFIFLSFGARVALLDILIITSAIMIIRLIPSPINFFGIREAVFLSMVVFFYNKVGVPEDIAFGTYIIVFMLNYVYALAVVLLFDHKSIVKKECPTLP